MPFTLNAIIKLLFLTPFYVPKFYQVHRKFEDLKVGEAGNKKLILIAELVTPFHFFGALWILFHGFSIGHCNRDLILNKRQKMVIQMLPRLTSSQMVMKLLLEKNYTT
ncbi:uncharacterized protein LOC107782017 isoform X2 [Nicotiana tabacum]|uniref:Uncharacterized protein LOC107782017 isoform X2 n=2 Tax=Nicotiana TaxID=4085 RepID=A0AC58RQR3_TOBAC|nr:PREDICTED: uncharacterized protein LOC104245909 isoform X2 [Nicotiana sylvestris]